MDCPACNTPLAPGEPQTRVGETRRFRVTAENLPVLRCPKGCPGLFWSHLDLGVDAYDLLHYPAEHFARIRGVWLWARQACRGCGGPLATVERSDFRSGRVLPRARPA
ncbi:MAG: hypothetical protein SF051_15205 [Elusimicrobiota bacterium]|nr:hypothetical protein [Elusimicrobiota bacterium]